MFPSPEDHPSPTRLATNNQPNEFTSEERSILLHLAHEAILSALEKREIPSQPPSSHLAEHLAEPRGVFTTIHVHSALHGCVGLVLPVASLYRNVIESARSAAFEDTRFSPITREEAAVLEISLSILSPLIPMAPEEIEIGRHGLLISMAGRRGLLLPQVPVEHGWDRITFLEQTCKKAGLPLDAWKNGARIEVFTAEVFGEQDTQS
jgi:AmmeMemoRadiSam system protein A